jgi:response regulator RpfG family c-di-GMP phosphodiesterase
MTLFPASEDEAQALCARLADTLLWYGAIGDAVCELQLGFGERKAALAVALAEVLELPENERCAVYFAGILHAVGAIGNPAHRKGERLAERCARMERWDIPAQGARICAAIACLPAETADMVRWQSECWDGTGYPDQLRWHGIPRSAQCLALADLFLRQSDPEDALAATALQSGRAFGPQNARAFTAWFHMNAGEAPQRPLPLEALHATGDPLELLELIADRIDSHNSVPGRWRRVAHLAVETARALRIDERSQRALALAAHLFGAGEVTSSQAEDESFDPLARLGIEERAAHAATAAALAAGRPTFDEAASIIAAREEWYDGTGKPRGLSRNDVPAAAGILAAAIAYCRLDRGERLETAAGTQFDPQIVRAIIQTAKLHA